MKLIIGELRKKKGITQTELADFLGVSFQSVSKWENHTTMPDINLLPKLSNYFQVSVDELLGLKPLKDENYQPRGTDKAVHWNKKLDYLKRTRTDFWNDDYLKFLVKEVWKINAPINIIDFGCGYGYLGLMLLPILPKGSTYTGVDVSKDLIDEAKTLFLDLDYQTNFINCDIQQFDVKAHYDMAICQAFLRHLPNPKNTLKKMIESVSIGGKVICIEVNRKFEDSGIYIHGMNTSKNECSTLLNKIWEEELVHEGRDYRIGMKIPFYMEELGLKNIDVRLNDKVSLLNPNEKRNNYSQLYDSLITANSWNQTLTSKKKEEIIQVLMNRKLTRNEAEQYISSEINIRRFVEQNMDNIFALKTLGLLISYGTK